MTHLELLSENELPELLKQMRKDVDELKNRQLMGAHSIQSVRYANTDPETGLPTGEPDLTTTADQYLKKFLVTFVPDEAFPIGRPKVFRLFVEAIPGPLSIFIGNSYVIPLYVDDSTQTWEFHLVNDNLNTTPGFEGNGDIEDVTVFFYFWGFVEGTVTIEEI